MVPSSCSWGGSARACLHALTTWSCAYQVHVLQVGLLGAAYMDWVHHPVAGQPQVCASPAVEDPDIDAMVRSPLLLSQASRNGSPMPYVAHSHVLAAAHVRRVVPFLWTPIVLACIGLAVNASTLPRAATALLVCAGALLWQLLEYSMHR
jgi:hypothetical protein